MKVKVIIKILLISAIVVPLGLEILLRLYMSMYSGTDALFYGFKSSYENRQSFDKKGSQRASHNKQDKKSVKVHENEGDGYTKFKPNLEKFDQDEHGESFSVSINDKGFRGENFATEPTKGKLRIVTLGASSTFGYRNRTETTYPELLEDELNEYLATNEVKGIESAEVINLGVPHLQSHNILELFKNEALPLKPNIITFYEGVNDTQIRSGIKQKIGKINPTLKSYLLKLRSKSLLLAQLDNLFEQNLNQSTKTDLNAYVSDKPDFFVDKVLQINERCKENDLTFIWANQQATSMSFDRNALKDLTYGKEVNLITEKLEKNGSINVMELQFLTHKKIMDAAKISANNNNIPFIDIIESMDDRRDCLLSWVHLTPEGNAIIAKCFAEKIIKELLVKQ